MVRLLGSGSDFWGQFPILEYSLSVGDQNLTAISLSREGPFFTCGRGHKSTVPGQFFYAKY